MDIPELGKGAAQAREAEAEAQEPQIVPVETAFLVYVARDVNGSLQYMLTTDLDTAIVRHHVPTLDEVVAAMSVVTSDINSQKAAAATVQTLRLDAQRAMEQQQAMRIQQELAKRGK